MSGGFARPLSAADQAADQSPDDLHCPNPQIRLKGLSLIETAVWHGANITRTINRQRPNLRETSNPP
jgi:hypothetical protein